MAQTVKQAAAYAESADQVRRRRDDRMPFNGGRLLARALQRLGTTHLFTLSGAHIFPLYDGCVELGVRIIDTRHEESASHTAEGWSKVTRIPGVAAVTAGPGVTNAATGLASAHQNASPMLLIGGRASDSRWGQGALQEMDHVPMAAAISKWARTLHQADAVHLGALEAWAAVTSGRPGPAFFDIPTDALFTPVDEAGVEWPEVAEWRPTADPDKVKQAHALIAAAERPVMVVGSGAHWHHGEDAVRAIAEAAGLPVYANGLGRGLLPSDHANAFSRTRGFALSNADLVIVVGTPLDFRLNYGQPSLFPADYKLIRLEFTDEELARNRPADVGLAGHVGANLGALAEGVGGAAVRHAWLEQLRLREDATREKDRALLESDSDPIHPVRVYGELLKQLDRDAYVVCDGGDFVSYAGKYVPSHLPGHWLDPGPFGALGMGPGQAIAARLAAPDRQVVMLMGDGAFGFSAMEFDTMVRHRLPVVAIVGNNGMWGLEKHPMESIYGYSVAAELNPAERYDQVVTALGGHGELVTRPGEIGPAIRRAFESGLPALVNVVCDPAVVYPRQTLGM